MANEITDVYALACAVAFGTLAVLHVIVWRTHRRRWCAGFALAYLLAALIFAFEPVTRPVGDRANPYAAIGALVTCVLLVDGMIDYIGLGGLAARRLRIGALGAAVIALAALSAGLLTRLGGAAVVAAYLAAIASMALWAMRREPGCGYSLTFLALIAFPAVVLAAWGGGVPVSLLRYVAGMLVVMGGMTILTTGLARAHRRVSHELRRSEQAEAALRNLNESLEQRIAQRTSELHDMVAALEAFNRHVSHDLRGPLGGIAGASRLADEALQRGDITTAARMLPAIKTQAELSVQLLAALLELARVGDARLVPEPVALESVVRGALAQITLGNPQATAALVTLTTPLPEVEADPHLLRQVYVNLIANAIKFSSNAATPRVEVGVVQDNGLRAFYVRDNGVGFDGERAQRLFQPFQRLHEAGFSGHGVGLSIVKRIVERHGGRIWADSASGQGTTFYFTLAGRALA
jgi:signal transduction histidine kinase